MSTDRITVAADEEFTISLESIATAGYVWRVESLPDGIQLLGTENENFTVDAKPGDSTVQIFRFRAHKRGEHEIKFALGRSWEKKPMETKTLSVKVT